MSLGTGSIYQRKSDGLWAAAVVVGGRRIVRYAKTERQARLRLRQLIGEEERRVLTPPTKITVGNWSERWLSLIEPERRPATIATYRYALEPFVTSIGLVRLDRFTPELAARSLALMRQDGRGSRRLSQSFRVLHTCLSHAVKLGILGANPLERVDRPRYQPKERAWWTLGEAQLFITTCTVDGGWYGPMLLFLLGTGLRRGECTALTWRDIDLAEGTVTVDKAVAFVRNQPILQDTKTKAGRREIALTGLARTALGMLPRSVDSDARIFLSGAGTPPTPSNVRTALHRVCDRAGVARVAPHALRHTHISLLLDAGVDVVTVSRRAGHSKASITLDVYGHRVRTDNHAATAFDRAIGE
jgi:integrase